MAEKVLMIALSPTMEEGTIVKWEKKEGDQVASGDLLCEVETDKATMEYESSSEGTLLKVIVSEGGSARVSDPIAILGEKGEDISSLMTEIDAASKHAAGAPADAASAAPESVSSSAPVVHAHSGPPSGGLTKASPLARNMAAERGIDLSAMKGTGPGGRIVKRDIETAPSQKVVPAEGSLLIDEIVPVTGKRKVIAQRLTESMFQAPHYYLTLSIAMDGMITARTALNARSEEKVSLNAYIMRFAAEALKRHPMVNAGWKGETIQKFGSVDIGLAVAVADGLITPIVRNCGNKGIQSVERELKVLIPKAREGKLLPEEYSGATFTITNLGSFGIEEFTAIINPPGSAILALGKAQKQAVVVTARDGTDSTEIRTMMKATLSCDHRVIDGATGAAFLATLKAVIENPIEALY